jgi:hypothetical protein
LAVAAGIAVAGQGNGNNKTFEYAIASGAICPTPTSRRRQASRIDRRHEQTARGIRFSLHDGDLKAHRDLRRPRGQRAPAVGDDDVQWVKALVDPESRDVFAFQLQVVPANRLAVPSP